MNLMFKFFAVVALASFIALLLALAMPSWPLKYDPIKAKKEGKKKPEYIFKVRAYEDFDVFSGKRLFRAHRQDMAKNIVSVEVEGDTGISNFNLVGIIEDDGKKAVIEDQRSAKTFFLKEGDMLSGVTLLEIKDHAIIMEKDGKNYDLML